MWGKSSDSHPDLPALDPQAEARRELKALKSVVDWMRRGQCPHCAAQTDVGGFGSRSAAALICTVCGFTVTKEEIDAISQLEHAISANPATAVFKNWQRGRNLRPITREAVSKSGIDWLQAMEDVKDIARVGRKGKSIIGLRLKGESPLTPPEDGPRAG